MKKSIHIGWKPLILGLSLLLAVGTAQSQNAELESIFERVETIDDESRPNGDFFRLTEANEWRPVTVAERDAIADRYREQLQALQSLDDNSLTKQEGVSKAIMSVKLQNAISAIDFRRYYVPFNAEGGFYSRPLFPLRRLELANAEEYEAYLTWLANYPDYIDAHIALMREGISQDIVAPKVIIENNIKLLAPWLADDMDSNPFATPINKFTASMEGAQKDDLLEKGLAGIASTVLPAYRKLEAFFSEEYLPAAPDKVGINGIPDGKAYYEDRIRFFTTLDMSPDSVFQLGMSEVRRIRSAMEQIIDDLGFEGDFAQFIEFLRTDPQFYPKTPEEYLYFAAWLSKKAEGALPPLFEKLYELPFTVAPVPDEIAPTYTGGRYVPGSRSQDRAGTYWVNTYNLKSRPFYVLPALTLHEAAPGHHLQGAMSAELEDIPNFRRRYYISAYGEGWGLYSEYLGEEMGMYTTPYEWFGRYTYEMWRACRLVVDVGMHYKDWTREQAVEFMASNTALSMHEVNTEINRYIGWPAQAVSYKVGEITIKRLRERATGAMGDQFDIQKFHGLILENGSVPLTVLEDLVDEWIEASRQSE